MSEDTCSCLTTIVGLAIIFALIIFAIQQGLINWDLAVWLGVLISILAVVATVFAAMVEIR